MSFCYGYGGVVPIKTNWAGEGQSVSFRIKEEVVKFKLMAGDKSEDVSKWDPKVPVLKLKKKPD